MGVMCPHTSIIERIINMIFRTVATKSVCSDLELPSAVAKGHKPKNPQQDANSFSRDIFDRADINRLGIISQPVSKIDSGNHQLVEFLSTGSSGHQKREESVFDISMAPCLLSVLIWRFVRGILQFNPSTFATLAMFPAPKACAPFAKKRTTARVKIRLDTPVDDIVEVSISRFYVCENACSRY